MGGSGGTGANGGQGGSGGEPAPDILTQLEAIAGATVTEEPSDIGGYRYFLIDFEQPVDHAAPDGQRFSQRIALHHRSESAPTVLASTGYGLFLPYQYLEEPSLLLDANQLFVEHRFFSPSRPDPADWTKLDIEQAAADHHRIVEAFRAIYDGRWISTGASKGGMTSVYHRRFYPDDVAGTVAYVAPLSYGLDDQRYVTFLAEVGSEPCRQALRDFQREVLLRRAAMLERATAQAVQDGYSYDIFGLDPTLESSVISVPFAFWQYGGSYLCADIPTSGATDDEVWSFLEQVSPVSGGADDSLLWFEPYYWQAYTELGAPGIDTSHLSDLLLYDLSAIDDLPSVPIEPELDAAAMQDIASWVATDGEGLLFVYGDSDPWTAGAFELGGATDSYRLFAPGQNHYAQINVLGSSDAQIAYDALESWAGVSIYRSDVPAEPQLDARSFRLLRPR